MIRGYIQYLREVRLQSWFKEWRDDLADEIASSPVTQVELVLAVIGIVGVVSAAFSYMLKHPVVPFLALSTGVLAAFFVSCADYAQKRRTAEMDGAEPDSYDLDALLSVLLERRPMSATELAGVLENPDAQSMAETALEAGWLERSSGAFKLRESMRPLARKRLARRREGVHQDEDGRVST